MHPGGGVCGGGGGGGGGGYYCTRERIRAEHLRFKHAKMLRRIVGHGKAKGFTAEGVPSLFVETAHSRQVARAGSSNSFFSVNGVVIIVHYFGNVEHWVGSTRIDASCSDARTMVISSAFPVINSARIVSDRLEAGQILSVRIDVRDAVLEGLSHHFQLSLPLVNVTRGDDVLREPHPFKMLETYTHTVNRRLPVRMSRGAHTLRVSIVDSILYHVICYVDLPFDVENDGPETSSADDAVQKVVESATLPVGRAAPIIT